MPRFVMGVMRTTDGSRATRPYDQNYVGQRCTVSPATAAKLGLEMSKKFTWRQKTALLSPVGMDSARPSR